MGYFDQAFGTGSGTGSGASAFSSPGMTAGMNPQMLAMLMALQQRAASTTPTSPQLPSPPQIGNSQRAPAAVPAPQQPSANANALTQMLANNPTLLNLLKQRMATQGGSAGAAGAGAADAGNTLNNPNPSIGSTFGPNFFGAGGILDSLFHGGVSPATAPTNYALAGGS